MNRILALDIGHKYIGVAVSDPFGWTAQGLTTITRDKKSTEMDEIKSYVDRYKAQTIVVGMPINKNGTYGPSSAMVKEFSDILKEKLGVEIVYQDERLSSVSAENVLIEGSIRRENRKYYIDKVAATLILQTYLDQQ